MTNLLSYAIIIDMMKREYEIISHAETNFKVFVVNLLYRAPHIHKDFELGLVLDGNISILLQLLTHHFISHQESQLLHENARRTRSISQYIEQHAGEKLLLSDIAARENLSLYYLSHLFKETFGMPFQTYLLKIRCENARRLLLLTDLSLLDICISCGFSDPKYFNKGFRQQYQLSPKEYRQQFRHEKLPQQQKSMLTTQEFLSESASLVVLENAYRKSGSYKLRNAKSEEDTVRPQAPTEEPCSRDNDYHIS